MSGALAGIHVLEFSEMIAGPFAGMHLADLGAEIIKVEPLHGDPWRLTKQFAPHETRQFMSLNRSKRGIAVDLKSPAGQAAVHRMVPWADVVLVNARPDTPARLGIDFDTLRAINPRLVYGETTAMGRRGPAAHRPGYDLVAQAVSGMLVTGQRFGPDGEPLPITPALADYGSGIALAMGVCAALFERERTGEGQRVETSLLATSLSLQTAGFVRTAMDIGAPFEHSGNDLDPERRALSAYYRVYETADTQIAIACLTPVLRQRLAATIGVDDARHGPDGPASAAEALEAANAFMTAARRRLRERTTAAWMEVFDAAGIPAGPVRHLEELLDDPQVRANDLVAEVEHPIAGRVELVGPLVRMASTSDVVPFAPPTLGQHTAEVLAEFGLDDDAIASLRRDGVIPAVGVAT